MVVECITVSHLQNGLDMSKAQATSFVQTYYADENIRFNRSEADAYDQMLFERSKKMIGYAQANRLLGTDKQELEAQERHTLMQSNIDRLEQKINQMEGKILAAIQPLMSTSSPPQDSTSATHPISVQHARMGEPNAVHHPPALKGDDFTEPLNGGPTIPARDRGGSGGRFHGQGSRIQERDVVIPTPPRRCIQAQHSIPCVGAKEGPYDKLPLQTRPIMEAREISYAPPNSQTSAVAGESATVFPADLVFWR